MKYIAHISDDGKREQSIKNSRPEKSGYVSLSSWGHGFYTVWNGHYKFKQEKEVENKGILCYNQIIHFSRENDACCEK